MAKRDLKETCARCGHRYGHHSPEKEYCPSDVEARKYYTFRKFVPMSEYEQLQKENEELKTLLDICRAKGDEIKRTAELLKGGND